MDYDKLIDQHSIYTAKAKIEDEAKNAFMKNYASLKEDALQKTGYKSFEADSYFESRLAEVAEMIAVYAIIFVLEKKNLACLYAEVSKLKTTIKADGYYGHILLSVTEMKPDWLYLSSVELWKKVCESNPLLMVCLDYYGNEFIPK